MNVEKVYSVIGKLFKGMIAGGLAQISVALSSGATVASLSDIQNLSKTIIVAFVTGAILACYKMLTWEE